MSLRQKVEVVETLLVSLPEGQRKEALATLDGIAKFAFGSQDVLPDVLKAALTDVLTSGLVSSQLRGPERTRTLFLEAMADCPTVRGLIQRYV